MNSYKFTLSYDNNGDARDASKTIKAYLLQTGSPNAADSVRYDGSKVVFEIAGNVSALSFSHQLTEFGAVFIVEPVGDSEPLLVPKTVTDSHIVYMKA